MSGKVKVIDILSEETLFQCEINEIEKAYAYAEQMEEIGLDIKITAPSAPETLARSLGASEENIHHLVDEIHQEIKDHDIEGQFTSCTFCVPDNKLDQ